MSMSSIKVQVLEGFLVDKGVGGSVACSLLGLTSLSLVMRTVPLPFLLVLHRAAAALLVVLGPNVCV